MIGLKKQKILILKIWDRPKKIKDFIENPLFEKGLPKLQDLKNKKQMMIYRLVMFYLFQSTSGNLDHVAVYIGDNMILNHNIRRLSCREPFDLGYQQALRGVYRYAA